MAQGKASMSNKNNSKASTALKTLEQVNVIRKSETTLTCKDNNVSLEAATSDLTGGKSHG
jgi:hypothetical protein